MGSSQTTNQASKGYADTASLNKTYMDQGFADKLGQATQAFGNLYGQRVTENTPLSSWGGFTQGFSAPVASNLAQGQQAIAQKTAATNRGLQQNLSRAGSGNNANIANVMAARGALQGAGLQNALYGDAMNQQRQYDVAQQGILANQNQQQLAAREQRINELNPLQNLMSLFGQLGLGAGTQAKIGRAEEEKTGQSKTKSSSGLMGLLS